jgi:3-hydroxyacyl-CoA dehydrogenase
MAGLIKFEQRGDIALVVIDRPPVNALNQAARQGLLDAVRTLRSRSSLKAMVLVGAGDMFSAGSDITEFTQARKAPSLAEVMALIETSPKPVFAMMHGRALGGGLELSLACHARLCTASCRLAVPEVKLGLLPGAGATQRLPRLVGPVAALSIIASGRDVPAEEALSMGLVDALVGDDAVADAMAFAEQSLALGRVWAPAAQRDDRLTQVRSAPDVFEAQVADVLRKARGQAAPQACVTAVRASLSMDLQQGLAEERRLFEALEQGVESRAMRHLFFAEREAARLPADLTKLQTPPIRSAAVMGAGLMGSSITMCFADVGIPVILIDTGEAPLQRALDTIGKQYERARATGRLTATQLSARMAAITTSVDISATAGVDVVIEAAPEVMALKEDLFRTLGRVTRPGTLLATNTSTLDVNRIADASGRPDDVVGLHFFSPAHVMRLIEIVRGAKTTDRTLARAVGLARTLKKLSAVVGVCDGFVANRMMGKRSLQVDRLLLEGASPRQIDRVTTHFGFPMGPLAVGDLAGLDVAQKVRQSRGQRFPVADAICALGRYGQKTGAGYYRYEAGSRQALDDALIDQLLIDVARSEGVTRRTFSDGEILDRTLLPIINEGARVLSEGMVTRASDIDVILVHGYGWPAWRGGPMFHADQMGVSAVCTKLRALAVALNDASLKPAPLLLELAAQSRTLLGTNTESNA